MVATQSIAGVAPRFGESFSMPAESSTFAAVLGTNLRQTGLPSYSGGGFRMKVSEIAEEFGVPASAVLDQCQRFGIAAQWAGAALSERDLEILRSEMGLATSSPLNSGPPMPERAHRPSPGQAPAPGGPSPAWVGAGGAPPTSVLSMIDEVEDLAEPTDDHVGAPPTTGAGVASTGGPLQTGNSLGSSKETVPPRPGRFPLERRYEGSLRTAMGSLLLAAVSLGGAEVIESPWAVWGLWVIGGWCLLVALWHANSARRHIVTHPEKLKGLGLTVASIVVSIGALIMLGTSVYAAIGESPAADAPAGLGNRDSVGYARWGFHRFVLVADNGWTAPAKAVGTCWKDSETSSRDVDREEYGTNKVECRSAHTVESIAVFNVGREFDAPYPGAEALKAEGVKRCGPLAETILNPKDQPRVEGMLGVEIPTAEGWEEADRDISCVLLTQPRKGKIVSDED